MAIQRVKRMKGMEVQELITIEAVVLETLALTLKNIANLTTHNNYGSP